MRSTRPKPSRAAPNAESDTIAGPAPSVGHRCVGGYLHEYHLSSQASGNRPIEFKPQRAFVGTPAAVTIDADGEGLYISHAPHPNLRSRINTCDRHAKAEVLGILRVMTVNLSRNLHPMRLSRRSAPFNSDDFIFELKIDRFRSLAFVENGQCDLLSRNENTFHNFKHFTQWIGENLRVANAVLDGEIACVDQYGRSVFNDLLFRRRECVFFAFDLLFLDGDDLRNVPLVERKARLKKLLRRKRSRVLYVDHVEFRGQKFRLVALRSENVIGDTVGGG